MAHVELLVHNTYHMFWTYQLWHCFERRGSVDAVCAELGYTLHHWTQLDKWNAKFWVRTSNHCHSPANLRNWCGQQRATLCPASKLKVRRSNLPILCLVREPSARALLERQELHAAAHPLWDLEWNASENSLHTMIALYMWLPKAHTSVAPSTWRCYKTQ